MFSTSRERKQQHRIFGSRVAFRIVACVRRIESSGCDDEWHFLFESSTWRQPHILRTFIIYFASIRQLRELEVKYEPYNSKMENNCFSDIFIGYFRMRFKRFFQWRVPSVQQRMEFKSTNQIQARANKRRITRIHTQQHSKANTKLRFRIENSMEMDRNDAHSIWN